MSILLLWKSPCGCDLTPQVFFALYMYMMGMRVRPHIYDIHIGKACYTADYSTCQGIKKAPPRKMRGAFLCPLLIPPRDRAAEKGEKGPRAVRAPSAAVSRGFPRVFPWCGIKTDPGRFSLKIRLFQIGFRAEAGLSVGYAEEPDGPVVLRIVAVAAELGPFFEGS